MLIARRQLQRVCSKWLIAKLVAQKMHGVFEFKSQSAVAVTVVHSAFSMAKRSHMQPFSSRKNQPPPSDSISTWTTDDTNFQELGKGFYPPNTTTDMRKCTRLFQDWAMGRNVRQGSRWCLDYRWWPNPIPSVVQILHRNMQGSWHSLSSMLYLDDNYSDVDVKIFWSSASAIGYTVCA